MIPWVVARELRATLLDYLRSTWSLADRGFEAALFKFLSGPQGMFQGPYLRVALPFAPAPAGVPAPLDIVPPYPPHLHQLLAWQRLSSRGQEPRATLITTGTGSGKTECFMFPLLDHALRATQAGKAGIKAIVLYPMNALASDQAGRFADTIFGDERLRGRVKVGLFVGGTGTHRTMGPSHVIDDNDHLRAHPPDILLTNYRMLDLLLQRPKDAPLWAENLPETLRYVVLDELHTYDGAQGTDVACLLRRLGHRLGGAERICPIGTSATVGAAEASRQELLSFAGTLFDQAFEEDAFIGETRLEPSELLDPSPLEERVPDEAGPWPDAGEAIEPYVARCVRAWLPPGAQAEILSTEGIERVALGRWVVRLPIARALMQAAHRRPIGVDEALASLASELARYAAGPRAAQEGWLASALTLLSYAQRQVGARALPLVSVQATLWIRELRRLLAHVDRAPAFRFLDDAPPPAGEVWLPRYACRDCGHGGWLITESGPGDRLGLDYKDIARAFGDRDASLRLLFDGDVGEPIEDGASFRVAWLDPKATHLLDKPIEGRSLPRLLVSEPDSGKLRCPSCDALDTLQMVAARATTLSSVAVGHLFTTPLNSDRKLLTFSDSVQDAAHRAGFFGARTYRFAIRSALLAAVPHDSPIPLSELATATWAYWVPKLGDRAMSGEADLVARLLPLDLHFLTSVEDWHDRLEELTKQKQAALEAGEHASARVPEPSPQLLSDLRQRLRWEATRELGLATRIGRTLEQSGCVSLTLDEARLEKAVRELKSPLEERLGLLEPPGERALRAFVRGLLTRLRLRGGVYDPLLEPYLARSGTGFMLSKEQAPLLTPFTPDTNRPLFITNAPRAKRFDSTESTRGRTWLIDWTSRSLGVDGGSGMAAEVYRFALPILARAGLLVERTTDEAGPIPGSRAIAWGLDPSALLVSRRHGLVRCPSCGVELATVPGSASDPTGDPCLRFRCNGRLEAISALSSEDEEGDLPVATYYKRFYEKAELGRLWAREHTGLLEREAREQLELEFKERPRPDSPNLLSCTPTLEMGVDIGDLSATLLCSVPPSTASYVQRVGRAGRKTGNALVLAFAPSRAHDLYFFNQPLEAMAGTIHPPGCYLSAPEVLKRQALAFCFDAFARRGGRLPGRVGDALKGEDAKRFPQPLLALIGEERARLQTAFTELFGKDLTDAAKKTCASLFDPAPDGSSPLERTLASVTSSARDRRDDLKQSIQRLATKIDELAAGDVAAKKVDDAEDEVRRLRDERHFLSHQLMALVNRDLFGWLTIEGCLPNYAFPERGIKLDAYIRRQGVGREGEHHEWVRPPSAAIVELAPFNTFYGSARRVRVDGVELKREAPHAEWSFCRSCHHAAPTAGLAQDSDEPRCPACGDEGWGDVGLKRRVLPLGQVYAVEQHRDAVLGDDADDRRRAFYDRLVLFEAEPTAREAWASDASGFGFELQPRLIVRELNLGPRGQVTNPPTMRLAGQEVPEVAFVVCPHCGQAQAPAQTSTKPLARHRAWCAERKKPEDKQATVQVHLMRQLCSEALRLVVPLVGSDSARDLANLRAALRLGLERLYGGEPDFLEVRAYDEPLPEREGRRRFLVVIDRVPGGTGLLAELALNKGAKLLEALKRSHEALCQCACQKRVPAARACYQCLYAYREGTDLPLLERTRALELVERVLEAFDSLKRVDGVGFMSQSSVLESELEHRFVGELERRVLSMGGTFETIREGEYELKVGARGWLMKAQVELTGDQVEVPCRADFVLYPREPGHGVRPVAVFTDGLAFHVMPRDAKGRLGDDAAKRRGVSRSSELLSWSLTYKDIVSPNVPPVPRWIGDGATFNALQSLVIKVAAQGGKEKLDALLPLLEGDPLEGLVAYLQAPTRLDELARLAAFYLLQRGKRQPVERVERVQASLRSDLYALVPPLIESSGNVAIADLELGEHARLVLDVEAARLPNLTRAGAGVRATVRLEDEQARRSTPGFELSWRLWLRAWNVLQTLPDAELVTRDLLDDTPPPASVRPELSPQPTSLLERDKSDPRIAQAAEIADAHTRARVVALLERHPALQAPTIPIEHRPNDAATAGDLELGWPATRVAAYFDHQRSTAEALEREGWTVLAIERRLTVEDFEAALGLKGSP